MRLLGRQIYNTACTHIVTARTTKNTSTTIKIHIVESATKQMVQHLTRKSFSTNPIGIDSYFDLLNWNNSREELKQIHAHMLINGLEQNIFLGTKLVDVYSMRGNLENSRLVFDRISERNVYIWNVLIRGHVRNGLCEEAIELYSQMLLDGIFPDKFTFPCVLNACADVFAVQQGREIHGHLVKSAFEYDVFVASALVAMFAKCGSAVDARKVFDRMPQRDVVVWNAMITAYSQNGFINEALKLFGGMGLAGENPDSATIASILAACSHSTALQEGKQIHSFVVRSGFESDVFVGSALIDLYAKCGSMDAAWLVFGRMTERNAVSWNTMIAGYVQNEDCDKSVELFQQMQLSGVKPDAISLVCVLSACSSLASLQLGKDIHGYIIKNGFDGISVGNALIDMYSKCNVIEDACKVFNSMFMLDVVSWCTMVAGYAQNGDFEGSLNLFGQMQLEDIKPDSDTVASVLPACAQIGALQQGKEIHGYAIKNRLETDVFVGSGLIDMYAKCGRIDVANRVFNKMSKKNVVPWNVMIVGFVQNRYLEETLRLFCQIQLEGVIPDSVTVASTISACAGLAALQQGKEIHNYVIKSGFECDVIVDNGLIDMYAKCGSIEAANQIFELMRLRDVVSWNVMISGYGMHGNAEDALSLFSQMEQAGMKPDNITFVSILSACSHAGLVDEGRQHFSSMNRDYNLVPSMEHYACMVDILGRSGCLDEALEFINNMPIEADARVWGALFCACRIHNNVDLGEYVADCLFKLKPENAGYYVLLSNIYATAGRWDDRVQVRAMMKDKRLKKIPGCSWIEVKNQVHAFIAGE